MKQIRKWKKKKVVKIKEMNEKRKRVRQKKSTLRKKDERRLLGCSTGGCSTIQIKQKLFDDLKCWDVRLGFSSTNQA